jgi:hypothetical protein
MGMAQSVLKGRAENISYKVSAKDWTKEEKVSCLITFTNTRVVIYSQVVQEYDIINEIDPPLKMAITSRAVTSSAWKVIDKDGKQCKVQLVGYPEGAQLYVVYTDLSICYEFQII